MNAGLANPLVANTWAHTLCDCCYTDSMGNGKFCPYFFPMSLIGTCCIVGRVQTLMDREDSICCEMGSNGWCCCLLSFPVAFFGPLGGALYFCFLSNVWRKDIIREYNIVEERAGK